MSANRRLALLFACASMLVAAAPGPTATPSALESNPAHWTDLLADAGPELRGWTRLPWPGGKPLAAEPPREGSPPRKNC